MGPGAWRGWHLGRLGQRPIEAHGIAKREMITTWVLTSVRRPQKLSYQAWIREDTGDRWRGEGQGGKEDEKGSCICVDSSYSSSWQ